MQFATSQSHREEFTMEESPVTPVVHSSDETPNVKSFQYAKEKDNAASLTWIGSSALVADTINASGMYKQL